MVGHNRLVVVAGGEGSGWLEHEDGTTGRGRLVLGPLGHNIGVALGEMNRRLDSGRVAQRDVEDTIEDEEELIGVGVGVPHVFAQRVGDPHVVVVHRGHDSWTPHIVKRGEGLVKVDGVGLIHAPVSPEHREIVLYIVDVAEVLPAGCRVEAWRPPGIPEISEVLHAQIQDYGYPEHCHDTWTVLIVDRGTIAYDLDRRRCGAVGETVAILPPGVTHNGKPAPGTDGFSKRVLYLEESVLPVELVGAAVDRTNIQDPTLRRALVGLHDELKTGGDPFTVSSSLALVAERITHRLVRRPGKPAPAETGIAEQLRNMLDDYANETFTLDDAARRLDRSKAHLVRSFSAQYGVAPHAYLIGKRVEAARGLLLQGISLAETAARVGFYDQSHLTRHFKRHTSVTPGRYAASHQR